MVFLGHYSLGRKGTVPKAKYHYAVGVLACLHCPREFTAKIGYVSHLWAHQRQADSKWSPWHFFWSIIGFWYNYPFLRERLLSGKRRETKRSYILKSLNIFRIYLNNKEQQSVLFWCFLHVSRLCKLLWTLWTLTCCGLGTMHPCNYGRGNARTKWRRIIQILVFSNIYLHRVFGKRNNQQPGVNKRKNYQR